MVAKEEYLNYHVYHPTVNFINVKLANFSYVLRFSSYILALSKNLYKKIVIGTDLIKNSDMQIKE